MKFAYLIAVASASKTVPFPVHDCNNPNPDAFVPSPGGEEISVDQMNVEMDYFSRKFDVKHYNNAMKIFAELKGSGFQGKAPKVTTWELYNKSFAWPRVRKYELVEEGMNVLEHFEDNLNTNITNSVLLNNFITNAKVVQRKLKEKYHNGEFIDPATIDPQDE